MLAPVCPTVTGRPRFAVLADSAFRKHLRGDFHPCSCMGFPALPTLCDRVGQELLVLVNGETISILMKNSVADAEIFLKSKLVKKHLRPSNPRIFESRACRLGSNSSLPVELTTLESIPLTFAMQRSESQPPFWVSSLASARRYVILKYNGAGQGCRSVPIKPLIKFSSLQQDFGSARF